MNVLVDSSVWVGHFKQRNEHLVTLLEDGVVLCHPYVVAEVACGTPPNRQVVIGMLGELESAPIATQQELLTMLEGRRLYGRGCGLVDMGLLAAVLISERALIWTLDERLELLASKVNRAYRQTLNS